MDEIRKLFEDQEFALRNQSNTDLKPVWFARSIENDEYLSRSIQTAWLAWWASRNLTYRIPQTGASLTLNRGAMV